MAGFLAGLLAEVFGEMVGIFTASKLGWFGKIAGKVVSNETVQETVSKKVREVFGMVDETGKTIEEELLTRDIKNFLKNLKPLDNNRFQEFLLQLKQDPDRGEERLTAFRVFLASGIKKGARHVPEFINPPPGSKEKTIKVTYLRLDLDWAKGLIEDIVAIPDYPERKKYVELEGGFNTMKKKSEPHPIVEKAKDFAKKKAVEAIDGEKKNREDFNQTMSSWRERSKNWRNSR